MKNELTKNEQTKALAAEAPGGISDGFTFNAEEITLPRILLQQKTSKKVDAGTTKPGQIINSITDEVLGDTEKPVEVILLAKRNAWTVSTKDGTFLRSEPAAPAETRKSREWEITTKDREDNEVEAKQEFTTIFRALLVAGIASGDEIPVEISFKSKSYKAAKLLNSLIAFDQASGRPAYARTYKIGAATDKNAKGQSYYVWTAGKGVATTDEQKASAVKWTQFMKKHDLKVDEASDVEETLDSDEQATY